MGLVTSHDDERAWMGNVQQENKGQEPATLNKSIWLHPSSPVWLESSPESKQLNQSI